MDDLQLLDDLTAQLQSLSTAPPVTGLVLAACRDDASLDAALDGDDARPPDRAGPPASGSRADVWLSAVQVEGFRGIGPQVTLQLRPHAGLTLVVGRNGSGKSSFAEAAELVLTGDSVRWAQRPAVFREGWRNLHHDGTTQIAVHLRLDGREPVVLHRRWAAGATDPADAEHTAKVGRIFRAAGPPPELLDRIGLYRPFLSARDLERVITARPAELYDALAPILGLAPLSAADARLQRRRRERHERAQSLKSSFAVLCDELGVLDDDRAQVALDALGERPGRADLTTLAKLADHAAEAAGRPAEAAARRLIDGHLPDLDAALGTLRTAEAEAAGLAGSGTEAAARTTELLQRALALHDAEGDRQCPVCRTGILDDGWRTSVEEELVRLDQLAATARAAREGVTAARREAEHLLRSAHRDLGAAMAGLAAELPAPVDGLRRALAALPGLDGGTGPLLAAWPPVVAAYADLAEAATRWTVRRQDAWREPAAMLRRWLDDAAVVRAEADGLAHLTAARAALGRATHAVRAQRLAEFAGHSERIWQRLRHESNVDLQQMRMEGTSTARRVRFPVAVDGVPTNALAVMSQGELHALGLAVFLPRACAPASPYRFVVVDDPVQSMDPAKVDGLAEVLGEISETRQVVVFTHDDRLPEALRRLRVSATVWEVGRRAQSAVGLRPADDPATRYLDDARALVAARQLPEDARYPVVAGFCRSALEAAATDLYRARRYAAGESHDAVADALAAARTLHQRLTLALLDDAGRGGDLYAHLNRSFGHWAGDVVRALASGVHGAGRGMPLPRMVDRTTDLLARLR